LTQTISKANQSALQKDQEEAFNKKLQDMETNYEAKLKQRDSEIEKLKQRKKALKEELALHTSVSNPMLQSQYI
jgi:predicted RNase H-like nuclease (RuvC/YqgF family)